MGKDNADSNGYEIGEVPLSGKLESLRSPNAAC